VKRWILDTDASIIIIRKRPERSSWIELSSARTTSTSATGVVDWPGPEKSQEKM